MPNGSQDSHIQSPARAETVAAAAGRRRLLSRYVVAAVLLVMTISLATWVIMIFSTTAPPYQLPLPPASRSFLTATSGYAPRNYPNPAPDDVLNFWQDTGRAGELYTVATDWKNTQPVEVTARFRQQGIILVLGFQSPAEWENSVSEFTQTAMRLLDSYPQIVFLAIGNEVNLLYEEYPKEFGKFVSAFQQISADLKAVHPEVRLSTTFQYERLIGNGELFSGEPAEHALGLITALEGSLDFIGLSFYPHLDFENPQDIPPDYLAPIRRFTDKPIGITETGWMSRQRFGGGGQLEALNELGFTGSHREQVDYLAKLVELAQADNMLFISWAFIHDFRNWQEGDEPPDFGLFDSIGLKLNNGTPKPVWERWLAVVSGSRQTD